jgi:hypothetical protein
MTDKTPMTKGDAARIQSHADKTGTNADFKGRAQAAGQKNGGAAKAPNSAPRGGKK